MGIDQDFRLGRWVVRPSLNSVTFNGKLARLEPKAMEVLVCLAANAGKVVSKEQLIGEVWAGLFVGDDVLTRCISDLRRAFEDNPKSPRVIETIPKRGYRLLDKVEPVTQEPRHWSEPLVSWFRRVQHERLLRKRGLLLVAVTVPALALFEVWLLPWVARLYNNQGVRLQQRGQLEAAIQDYRRALRLNSGYAPAHYNLADAYEEIPNYEKALEEYQRAIDADLTFYPAYSNLSRLYILRLRDYGAALRLLDRALSLNPREPSVQYSLHKNYGWANFELHNFGQAEKDLTLAGSLDPNRGATHCLLAKVLDAQGRQSADEWESCAAFSTNQEVEPEWQIEARERLRGEIPK